MDGADRRRGYNIIAAFSKVEGAALACRSQRSSAARPSGTEWTALRWLGLPGGLGRDALHPQHLTSFATSIDEDDTLGSGRQTVARLRRRIEAFRNARVLVT